MPNPIQQRLSDFQRQPRMQAGSLIVSVFGDLIYPRGGELWLGSLIQLLEPLALNERLIRTAIFRLVKEDWLQSQAFGRRTNYKLSAAGQHRIEEASKLIYGEAAATWDEHWRILITNPHEDAMSRSKIRKALQWQGFGEWNPTTFLHPSANLKQVIDSMKAEGLSIQSNCLTLISKVVPTTTSISNHEVVATAWDLKRLGQGYLDFVKQYGAIHKAMAHQSFQDESLWLRILLIHDFRRLLLRDPLLPRSLLPTDWPGFEARHVFNELYIALRVHSEDQLDDYLKLADGSTPRRGAIDKRRMSAIQAAQSNIQMN